jgi:hypothetical protein
MIGFKMKKLTEICNSILWKIYFLFSKKPVKNENTNQLNKNRNKIPTKKQKEIKAYVKKIGKKPK